MNQWSRRRKRIILALIFFVLIVLIGLPIFFLFYRAPTCFDKKQNGNETEVDCGGSCQLLCTTQSLPLLLKGDPRVLKIKENTFELVAAIENPNANGEIYRAGYTFKLYGNSSAIPLKLVEGETYVPKGSTFAIFEGPFVLEEGAVPNRVTFEWKEESLVWRKGATGTTRLLVKDLNLSREDIHPRLDASIENLSLEDVSNIELVALISNDTDSIFAASKTFIDRLSVRESIPVVFIWPGPFNERALDIKIIIRIFPDRSFIR
jgi:hypothetical protein